ncbi:hypothetical protein PN36_10345 [Candidatus Thiomargarita nelsonii]|uniref:DUF6688 domain-containing protein n=1 Tax=Candidatus Thiomargarita nelsonii TaxID=1003181 RepID=A0A0A6P3W4_9GAMM|nr:hypothetical protein PN36_10345 [Candidatus Thiomargarita nelsonii]
MEIYYFFYGIFIILTILSPILLQIGCFPILIRYGIRYIKGKVFSLSQSILLLFGLVIIPALMFFLASVFTARYRWEKGDHWFYYIHDQWAGLVLMPVYLIASISLARSLFDEEYMATSRANYIMVATLAAIAAWYTYATLALNLTKTDMTDIPILAIVPAAACLNYLAFLFIVKKMGRLQSINPLFAFIWFSTLIASLIAKYPLAKSIYQNISEEIPRDYGDCFVVSAAAKGHPCIVQSWMNSTIGKPVNRQWYIFKRFEAMLALNFPQIHRILRRIYNRLGPFIAKQIRYPWQADIVYLLLKPMEWAVFIVLKLTNSRIMRISHPTSVQ